MKRKMDVTATALYFIFLVLGAILIAAGLSVYIYHSRPKTIQEAGPGAQRLYCESSCTPSFVQCMDQCRADLKKER